MHGWDVAARARGLDAMLPEGRFVHRMDAMIQPRA